MTLAVGTGSGSYRCGETTARLYLQVRAVLDRESAIQDQSQFILVSCKYKLSLSMYDITNLVNLKAYF